MKNLKISFKENLPQIHNSIQGLQKDVTEIIRDVKKLRIDLDGAINFFNREDLSTRSGLNKTRTELGLNEVEFAY